MVWGVASVVTVKSLSWRYAYLLGQLVLAIFPRSVTRFERFSFLVNPAFTHSVADADFYEELLLVGSRGK
jgi:hypothetical protein